MLFNSLTYLLFFVALLAAYWSLPWQRARIGLLLAGSWLFYACWHPAYLMLLLAVTLVNYAAGLAIGALRSPRPRAARAVLVLTVIANVGHLATFKYADFLLSSLFETVGPVFGRSGAIAHFDLLLPLGISFYTFEVLGYVIDVSRGDCGAIRSPWRFALFIAFFPHLIAGPIVRTHELVPAFHVKRSFCPAGMLAGLDLIVRGLCKKVLIADQLAPFVDAAFADPGGSGTATLWLAVYAYAVQIYGDFSGYTDIGRGCARCLGFELPENFDRPYLAANLADFWRRWHITLGTWLRDYVYIPLGGSRGGVPAMCRNLLITMTLGGLWHGAGWNFVLWGAWHGLALVVYRVVCGNGGRGGVGFERGSLERLDIDVAPQPPLPPLRKGGSQSFLQTPNFSIRHWVSVAVTFHVVCAGWILFRAPDLATAGDVVGGMFGFGAARGWLAGYDSFHLGLIASALVGLAAIHIRGAGRPQVAGPEPLGWTLARPAVWFGAMLAVVLVTSQGGRSFIYFQF